jgi:quinolinate synthase
VRFTPKVICSAGYSLKPSGAVDLHTNMAGAHVATFTQVNSTHEVKITDHMVCTSSPLVAVRFRLHAKI